MVSRAKEASSSAGPSIIGEPLPFDLQEYSERIERARVAVKSMRLDALLLFHQESMNYLFGYDQNGYWIYQTAVLPADGRGIHIVCREADEPMVRGLPNIDEVRLWYDDSTDDPTVMTVDVLDNLMFESRRPRIGIELQSHALLPLYYEALRSKLAGRYELVDASNLVTELRLRKSHAEIAYVRRAAEVLDASYRSAFAALRPGVRETDVLAAALDGLLQAGGDIPAIIPPTASGPRTFSGTHAAACDRVVRKDDLFSIEIGGCYRRYHSVGVQTKWVGTPPTHVVQKYDVLLQALAAGVSATLPGARTADVARSIHSILEPHGMAVPGNHFGYGTGVGYPPTWVDNLRIKQGDEHILEPGMLLFLFVWNNLNGLNALPTTLFIGEPVLVTAAGHDRLSSVPINLEV
jgi:Xaa-Pro dipeptidase